MECKRDEHKLCKEGPLAEHAISEERKGDENLEKDEKYYVLLIRYIELWLKKRKRATNIYEHRTSCIQV